MKFEEPEITEDSPQEVVAEPVVEKEEKGEETKPMLNYDNIKSSQDIEVPPLLIDQVIGHEESIETIKKAAFYRCYGLDGHSSTNPVGTFPITLKSIEDQVFQYNNTDTCVFKYEGTSTQWNNNVTVGRHNKFTVYCSDGVSIRFS